MDEVVRYERLLARDPRERLNLDRHQTKQASANLDQVNEALGRIVREANTLRTSIAVGVSSRNC